MRIALVCDWYSPRQGGIETHLTELGAQLSEAGHEIHVVTPTPGPATDGRNGVTVHRTDADLFPGFGFMYSLRGADGIRRTLDVVSPDIIHAHVSIISPAAFVAGHHAQRRGIPTVVTLHSFIPTTPLFMFVAGSVSGSRTWSAVFSAVSRRVAAEVAPVAGGRPVIVLPNAVDTGFWSPRGKTATNRTRTSIVSALRLNQKKRPATLLRLARHLRDSQRDFTLSIAGDGPMRASMARAVHDCGLDEQVRLLGRMTREELRALYESADLFVMPAIRESFGLAALEARSVGLPVVAMRGSGLAEQIGDGVNGLLAATDADLFAAVDRLIDDRQLRDRLACHNRTTPLDLDWPSCIRRHEAAYHAAVDLKAAIRAT